MREMDLAQLTRVDTQGFMEQGNGSMEQRNPHRDLAGIARRANEHFIKSKNIPLRSVTLPCITSRRPGGFVAEVLHGASR
jgi:hypothetical protein